MDAILQSEKRLGNFTSSEIHRLVTIDGRTGKWKDANALTYINEKKRERRIGRSLDNESFSKACEWGKLLEYYVFQNVLGLEYKFQSQETLTHPTIDCWRGTPDALKYDGDKVISVVDLKCPFTLNSFLDFAECKTMEEIREEHKDGEKYYWQLVSNSILTNNNSAELILFCPREEVIPNIKSFAEEYNGELNLYWLFNAQQEELPYIPTGRDFYKSMYKFEFEIPQTDKDFLEEKILWASKLLGEKK